MVSALVRLLMMATLRLAGNLIQLDLSRADLIRINAAESTSDHRNLPANGPEVIELIGRRDFVHAHLPWPKSFIGTNSDFVFFFAHSRFLA
jgi:hypothetical protein